MKTSILLTVLILINTIVVTHAQLTRIKRFDNGEIITKQGDTLRCLIEIAYTYDDKIVYKHSKDDQDNFISKKDVKSFRTGFSTVENIVFGKSERLMTEMEKGKATLYNYFEVPDEYTDSGSRFRSLGRLIYIIKMGDKYFEVESKPKKFKEQLSQLFSDCQPLIKKINAGELSIYFKLYDIVKEYNSCN